MVHFFDSDIAKKYGVNAAVLACFLWDCIEQKSTESPQLHEGKVWMRCSVRVSTLLVASSKIKILLSARMARAIVSSCFWPWLTLEASSFNSIW